MSSNKDVQAPASHISPLS